ncbi:uncharacterized protein N7482_003845 [Penicillium canariense]|uniref:Uncharacterized protein n=1 Tax=Penicillium canariense TaxID=189055 RepID=A0A9W9LPJ3_9EURO|nr:uncharacterized protein N7482_003845 [Penicillium canariense]KAJ5168251.1 hypothetical protein N7482_003845 [Penicillium canariense]
MADGFAPPVWLAENKDYIEYLRLGEAGALILPEYEKDAEGKIIVHPGEAFCRMKDCDRAKHKKATRNLRTHIKSHGRKDTPIETAKGQTGNLGTADKDEARLWFTNLIRKTKQAGSAAAPPGATPAPRQAPRSGYAEIKQVHQALSMSRTLGDVGGRELASALADGVSGGGSEAAVSAASTGELDLRWNAGPKGPAVPGPPPSARLFGQDARR